MSGELRGACIFGQSGGPTAVINASAYGVLKTALESDAITNVYGAAHGIRGVLDDRLYLKRTSGRGGTQCAVSQCR